MAAPGGYMESEKDHFCVLGSQEPAGEYMRGPENSKIMLARSGAQCSPGCDGFQMVHRGLSV